jgi:hypothetical protein
MKGRACGTETLPPLTALAGPWARAKSDAARQQFSAVFAVADLLPVAGHIGTYLRLNRFGCNITAEV